MLEIKQKPSFQLPHISLPRMMEFDPVVDDGDELTTAIAEDVHVNDDAWELSEHPDTNELERYWEKVEEDIAHDPEWFTFQNDEA